MAFEFEELNQLEVANVAQVPNYSPLRYPGGKSRWYPFVKRWLHTHRDVDTLVEPFAGGASIGLAAGIEGLVDNVVLVEINKKVASLWETIFNGDCEYLTQKISRFEITKENVEEVLKSNPKDVKSRAFKFLLRNRVSRGGITAEGAGILKNGEKGKGLKSRWYPETLVQRIESIRSSKSNFEFIWADGITVLKSKINENKTAHFVDPPYPDAGSRLYDHSEVDHERLLRLVGSAYGPVMATYDTHDNVLEISKSIGLNVEPIITSTTHHKKKHEVLISKDFSWIPNSIKSLSLFSNNQ